MWRERRKSKRQRRAENLDEVQTQLENGKERTDRGINKDGMERAGKREGDIDSQSRSENKVTNSS